jgi:hypothetical protein
MYTYHFTTFSHICQMTKLLYFFSLQIYIGDVRWKINLLICMYVCTGHTNARASMTILLTQCLYLINGHVILVKLERRFCKVHLPPLRFHCVRGCWVRTQDRCDFGTGCQTLYHSTRSFPGILTEKSKWMFLQCAHFLTWKVLKWPSSILYTDSCFPSTGTPKSMYVFIYS